MAAPILTEDTSAAPQPSDTTLSEETIDASTGFVGKWQTLESTTNWEKGRIICDWRAALEKSDAPVTQYSDEAWAQMVGDVTGQHVGRLRRTFDRFGEAASEYHGLYWSHFQIALDWEDAEMWLEGAVQNGWSISQMRAQRWEAVGDGKPDPQAEPAASAAASPSSEQEVVAEEAAIQESAEPTEGSSERSERAEADADSPESDGEAASGDRDEDTLTAPAAERREPVQPMKDLAELPEDLAEAFEQFKLAILTHKMTGWDEVSRDDVLASLAALEQLALAPSGE